MYRRSDRALFGLIIAAVVVGLVWFASSTYFTIWSIFAFDDDLEFRAFNGSTRWLQVAVAGSRAGYLVLLAGAVMTLLFRRSRRS